MSRAAVEVEGVSRTFRQGRDVITALDDVSFALGNGEVVGLLGANGAGKTTLTKIIGTMLLPTSGAVRVYGADAVRSPRAAREMTGVVLGGDRGLYGRLTGRENLEFFAMLGGIPRRELPHRVWQVLSEFGLLEAAGRSVETYSKGMRQRLHLAIGLVTRPRLLLLDEPTAGLDPVEAERLRWVIAGLRDLGVTVLLTSHYLLDIDRLADRVLLIAGGRLTGDMPVSQFRGLAGFAGVVTIRGTREPPALFNGSVAGLTVLEARGGAGDWTLRLRVQNWDRESFAALGRLLEGVAVVDMEVAPVRLEDVYAHVVQGATGVHGAPGATGVHGAQPARPRPVRRG